MTEETPGDRLIAAIFYGSVEAQEALNADSYVVMGFDPGDGHLDFTGPFPDLPSAMAHAETTEAELAKDAQPGEEYHCRIYGMHAPG